MRRALIALAAVAGLVALLIAALPWLAEPALRAGLRQAGLDDIRFERLRLGLGDLEVEGVVLGQQDQELGRLQVGYSLPDLLAGRLARVEIEGLVVRAAWRDGGLHLRGIETTSEAGGPLVLPDIEELVMRDARLELTTDLGTVELPLSAQFRKTGERLAFEASSGDARVVGLGPLRLGRAHLSLAGEGSMQAASGTLDLALTDARWSADGLDANGSLDQRLDWRYADDVLTVHASQPGALAIETLAGPDELRAGPIRLRIEPTEAPLLEVTFADGAPAGWRQSITTMIETLGVQLAAQRLQSQAGSITLAAEGDGPSLRHATVAVVGGALRLPEHALALDGIAAEVGLTADGLAPDQPVPVAIVRIVHSGKPAWFVPLSLQGRLTPGAQSLAFDATLGRIGGGVTLTARGEHQWSGPGRATVELAPVTFGPKLQPKDLAPIAAGLVSDVTGKLAANGELSWSADALGGDLRVLVEELGLTAGPARLAQVNGVIRLDQLWPPATPPGQQLAIGLLDLGLPLTSGITTFQLKAGHLEAGPRLEVEQLEWRFAGGTARAEPFSLGSPLEGANVTLRAEQLDLGQLLALTRLDGLTGEGRLDGVLPVRLSEGAAIIAGGTLATTRPGVLRYDAGSAPAALQAGGEGVGLLLQALENFRYERLEITLDGSTDAAMDIGLHLAGANPDLYDGHPIEFNLDLEGELGNILRQGVASYQIPDRIRERMQGFGR